MRQNMKDRNFVFMVSNDDFKQINQQLKLITVEYNVNTYTVMFPAPRITIGSGAKATTSSRTSSTTSS